MKQIAKKIIYSAIIFITVCLCTANVQAKLQLKPASFLPPETLLLVEIQDCNQLQKQFEKTSFYKFYKDPLMAAFFSKTVTKFKEESRKSKNEVLKAVVDTGIWPDGMVAAALVFGKQSIDTDEPQILIVSQWGQNLSKIQDALNKTVKTMIEGGAYQKTEKYRDCDIITVTKELPPKSVPDMEKINPESNDIPKKKIPQSEKFSYCYIEDCLFAGDDIELLKLAVANIKGAGNATLKDDADYGATLAAAAPGKDICLYVNIKQFIKTITAQDTSGQAAKYVKTLGMDNVSAFGMSVAVARSTGNSFYTKGMLKIDGTKAGICKMLEPENGAFNVPTFISPSVYTVTNINLDLKKAYGELYTILYGINPMLAGMMNTPLPTSSSPDVPGLQLKNDIIEHLGSQIIIAQAANKPFTAAGEPTDTLFAFSLSNRDALEKSLSLVHSKLLSSGDPEAKKELLGHTIYLLKSDYFSFLRPGPRPMAQLSENSAPTLPVLAFTVTDTHLIFGPQAAVEDAVRRISGTSPDSIKNEKWFNTAKSSLPSLTAVTILENYQTSAEILWWIAKQTGRVDAGNISDVAMEIAPMPRDFIDVKLLPEFETVKKYFGVSAGYLLSKPDGFFFESRIIDNP